jgi:hypothetical protein
VVPKNLVNVHTTLNHVVKMHLLLVEVMHLTVEAPVTDLQQQFVQMTDVVLKYVATEILVETKMLDVKMELPEILLLHVTQESVSITDQPVVK